MQFALMVKSSKRQCDLFLLKHVLICFSCHTAVDILVDDGLMIPTAKQLITLRIEQEGR